MALGAPIGSAIGALTADRWGRKPTIIGASLISVVLGIIYPMISDPMLLPAVGFALTVPIYVLVALLFGIYIPELFPTEVRLRASGIVNTLGRGATIVTPFLVVMLFEARGVAGVMALMIGLLVVQIVTVWALGIEPRHRSLEELKARRDGAGAGETGDLTAWRTSTAAETTSAAVNFHLSSRRQVRRRARKAELQILASMAAFSFAMRASSRL